MRNHESGCWRLEIVPGAGSDYRFVGGATDHPQQGGEPIGIQFRPGLADAGGNEKAVGQCKGKVSAIRGDAAGDRQRMISHRLLHGRDLRGRSRLTRARATGRGHVHVLASQLGRPGQILDWPLVFMECSFYDVMEGRPAVSLTWETGLMRASAMSKASSL